MGHGKRFGESSMKVGNAVKLVGAIWSSYECRKDEIGIVLETRMMDERSGFAAAEFSKVWWGKDGQVKMYKSDHLEVVN